MQLPAPFEQLFPVPPVTQRVQNDHSKEARHAETALRYEHLPEASHATVEAILKGFHPLEALPAIEPRIIRVYISSTYTGECGAFVARVQMTVEPL